MKPLTERDPFKLGLIAIVVIAVLGLVVLVLSVVSFGTRSYTAVLAQTAGLRAGEDVTVHGMHSGKVKSLELKGNTVVVHFALDKSIELGADTTAQVKVQTLLGTHALAVSPQGSGALAGDTIPLSRTSVPFNLQDVLEKGNAALQKLDPVILAKALTEASKTFSASSDQIGPALTGVARLSDAVAQRTNQTGALLQATRQVTDQLAAGSTDLVALMKQANLVVSEITSRRQAIHTLLVETTALARNLSGVVGDTKADLGPAFRKLNGVLQILRNEDASLKNMLHIAAPAVRYVANATGSGPFAYITGKSPVLPPDDVCHRLPGAILSGAAC